MSNRLSDQTVDALLDALTTNDGFRGQFQANPREATRSLGTNDPAIDSLPTAPMGRLASKQAMARSRDRLRTNLTSAGLPFQPITFEVPEIEN